jgi:hypothetical protein
VSRVPSVVSMPSFFFFFSVAGRWERGRLCLSLAFSSWDGLDSAMLCWHVGVLGVKEKEKTRGIATSPHFFFFFCSCVVEATVPSSPRVCSLLSPVVASCSGLLSQCQCVCRQNSVLCEHAACCSVVAESVAAACVSCAARVSRLSGTVCVSAVLFPVCAAGRGTLAW